MSEEEERLLRQLGEALAPEQREPLPERVAELRTRAARSSQATAAPPSGARRYRREALVAALTAAAVLLAVVVLLPTGPTAPPVATESITFAATPPGIRATGHLVPHTWGVELNLVIAGLPPGQPYRVVVQTMAGAEVPAGTFIGVADRPVECDLNAAVLRGDAAGFQVLTSNGERVLSADLA